MSLLIKLGGAALEDPESLPRVCREIAGLHARGVPVTVVHGGGPSINRELERRGISWTFVDGQRVTTPEMMDVIEMVLCGSVNRRIVRALNHAGVPSVGLAGTDASMLCCSQADARLGQVGKIDSLDTSPIRAVLGSINRAVPVVAPIGSGSEGQAFNVNADWVACRIAQEMGVERLLFLTDQEGILDENKRLIRQAGIDDLEALIGSGAVQGGMLMKTKTILYALRNGIPDVRVMNGSGESALLGEFGTRCRGELQCCNPR